MAASDVVPGDQSRQVAGLFSAQTPVIVSSSEKVPEAEITKDERRRDVEDKMACDTLLGRNTYALQANQTDVTQLNNGILHCTTQQKLHGASTLHTAMPVLLNEPIQMPLDPMVSNSVLEFTSTFNDTEKTPMSVKATVKPMEEFLHPTALKQQRKLSAGWKKRAHVPLTPFRVNHPYLHSTKNAMQDMSITVLLLKRPVRVRKVQFKTLLYLDQW